MKDWQIRRVPNESLVDCLTEIAGIVGGTIPNNKVIDIIIDQLKRYNGNTTLHDLKLSVEFATNGITKVDLNPSMRLPFIVQCIRAYKNHNHDKHKYEEKELSLNERYGNTEQERNEEMLEGFYVQCEKLKVNPNYQLPIWYVKWFTEIGYNIYDYIKPESEYKGISSSGDLSKFEKKAFHKADSLREAIIDFARYVNKSDLKIELCSK